MKSFFGIISSFIILVAFNTANAESIKWLHLFGEDSKEYPNIVKASKEFEEKTGHTVVLQYLENESFG